MDIIVEDLELKKGTVVLVATEGSGSMDIYARKLAEHLHVPKIYTNIYQQAAELFNISWLSPKAWNTIWADWRFVKRLNKLNGILHLPNHHLGRYGNFLKSPFIITVHDLIRYFDLKGHPISIHRPNLRDRFYLNLDYRGISKARRVIAVSHYTKKDLAEQLGIPEERIAVVYEGIDHSLFRPVKGKRPIEAPYILYVGSEHPRKNLTGLLRAFRSLKERFGRLKLVKVGKAGGGEANFRGQTLRVVRELGLEGEVIFTNFVPEEELPIYYSGAECFGFPSLFEGFGFPPLEAMACGCPVVASDVTSIPEVVGKAGLLVNPHKVEEITEAVSAVLTNHNLRRRLVARGLERAKQFSWEKTAKETLEVYQEVELEEQFGLFPLRVR